MANEMVLSAAELAYAAALDNMNRVADLGVNYRSDIDRNRGRWPDFFIIGAQKAGTTWLHRNLDYHPSVWLAPAKELNYFVELYLHYGVPWVANSREEQVLAAREYYLSLPRHNAQQKAKFDSLEIIQQNLVTDNWYRHIFSFAGADQICGEASPEYCVLPRLGISHLVSGNPAVKAILILRDPIDRLWSNIRMNLSRGIDSTDIQLLRQTEYWRVYQGRSNYPEILRRWRAFLPEKNLIIIRYDDIKVDPLGVLQGICDRLGIVFHEGFFPLARTIVADSKKLDMANDVYDLCRERLRPIYEDLMEIQPDFCGPWYRKHFG